MSMTYCRENKRRLAGVYKLQIRLLASIRDSSELSTYIMLCAGGNYDDIARTDMFGLAINNGFSSAGVEGKMLVDGVYFLWNEVFR